MALQNIHLHAFQKHRFYHNRHNVFKGATLTSIPDHQKRYIK